MEREFCLDSIVFWFGSFGFFCWGLLLSLGGCCLIVGVEMESRCSTETRLPHTHTLLHPTPQGWDYRPKPPSLTIFPFFETAAQATFQLKVLPLPLECWNILQNQTSLFHYSKNTRSFFLSILHFFLFLTVLYVCVVGGLPSVPSSQHVSG